MSSWHNSLAELTMALGSDLLKMLSKTYEARTFVERRFKGYDIGFKTNDEGSPIVLFIGKKTADGTIKGQRYARRLVKDKNGNIIKDHCDDKGKTS